MFFELWTENIPHRVKDTDAEAQGLEFYLYIHFTIYPLRRHPVGHVCIYMCIYKCMCLLILMSVCAIFHMSTKLRQSLIFALLWQQFCESIGV